MQELLRGMSDFFNKRIMGIEFAELKVERNTGLQLMR